MKLTWNDQQRLTADLQNIQSRYGVYVIVSVCSECGKITGTKDGLGYSGISHSLCTACKDETLAEARRLSEQGRFTA